MHKRPGVACRETQISETVYEIDMNRSNEIKISVCGWKDNAPADALKLCVGSWAPVMNPPEWRDLWFLSPLSTVRGGINVPGFSGAYRSMTVENSWQFLKIWPGEDGWRQDIAMEAFQSTCAVRYPKGKGVNAIGYFWGEDRSVLDYITARKKIYIPAYHEMLTKRERRPLIKRLRETLSTQAVVIWDPDSYDVTGHGMSDITQAVEYEALPFAHAFVVALAVAGHLRDIEGLELEADEELTPEQNAVRNEKLIGVFPLGMMDEAVNFSKVGKIISSLERWGPGGPNVIALHVSQSLKDRIESACEKNEFVRIEDFGNLAPIVNYGIDNELEIETMGDFEVSEENVVDMYAKLSAMTACRKKVAYICPPYVARLIKNIKVFRKV